MENSPLFRPPAEADSLIVQVDEGCPHNRCTFCGMYRGLRYRRRPIDEACALIRREARSAPETQRVFLADGDVMCRPFDELRVLLAALNDALPRLTRVNLYANGRSIAAKTDDELRALRAMKLHTLYMGLESGDEDILRHCRKDETAEDMVAAGIHAQATGLRMLVMILIGLGGEEGSTGHVRQTAAALNRLQPRLLSALRVIPVQGTKLHRDASAGRFRLLSERAAVNELRNLVARLDLVSTVFRANHSSNVVPVEARLPRDKARLIHDLDALLASSVLDGQNSAQSVLFGKGTGAGG